jgi:hypothetical protein
MPQDTRIEDAQAILAHVVSVAGHSPTVVKFRRANRRSSSGVAYGSWAITIRVGSDIRDTRSVIVHEVAHTLVPGEKHSAKFYEVMFKLVRDCGYDMEYSLMRERDYKPRNSAKAARKYRSA